MVRAICCVMLSVLSLSSLAQKWDTVPRLPQHYNARIAQFKSQKIAKGQVVFLGNGLIENGTWRSLMADSAIVNLGIEGDITFGVMARVREVAALKPSKIFLLIGTDDFAKGIPEENIMENIFSIAYKLKNAVPAGGVIVMSVLPVNHNMKDFPKGFDHNAAIFTVNEQLRKYSTRIGYTFVNLYSDFIDPKGLLDTKYTTDGVHLNAAGYQHWAAILKSLK